MEFVNVDLTPLSKGELDAFKEFNSYLSEEKKSGNILFLYRGEEQKNIKKRLSNGGAGVPQNEIMERAFYFGEKARHFAVDNFDPERNYLTSINDCSDDTLGFIFERIGNVLSDSKMKSKVMENTSRVFREFFLEPNNKLEFIRVINTTYTKNNRLKVRDYYLYFLHVAGSAGVRKETMFVSTSLNKRTALGFSKMPKGNKSRVIFHYFIPQPFYLHAIAPWISEQHRGIAFELRLPTYYALGLFPSQKEVSIKGALFPHFLLGIELVDEKKFIVNSHIENIYNVGLEQAMRSGIPIDQSDFENRIFDTGYIRWGQTDLQGNFEQFDV